LIFPFSLIDWGIWFAFNAILFLITSEILYSFKVMLDKVRMRIVAFILGLAFIFIVMMELYAILAESL
jgi:hypothetical protein